MQTAPGRVTEVGFTIGGRQLKTIIGYETVRYSPGGGGSGEAVTRTLK